MLRVGGIVEVAEDDPAAALATIHDAVITGIAGPNAMSAYAELAFSTPRRAGRARTISRRRCTPSPTSSRRARVRRRAVRSALPLGGRAYNRAVTKASRRRTARGSSSVRARTTALRPPRRGLRPAPTGVGRPAATEFALRRSSSSAVRATVTGGRAWARLWRRRRAPINPIQGFQVAARQRAPVTAVLRIDDARRALADGRCTRPWNSTRRPIRSRSRSRGARCARGRAPASLAYGLDDRRSGGPSTPASCSATCFSRQPTPARRAAAAPSGPFPGRARAWHGIERCTLGRRR